MDKYTGEYMDEYTNEYILVDCSFHDELEALATLRKSCQIIYRDTLDEIVEVQDQIVDVYARDHADFLRLKRGIEIRLDRLISVNGKPMIPISSDQ